MANIKRRMVYLYRFRVNSVRVPPGAPHIVTAGVTREEARAAAMAVAQRRYDLGYCHCMYVPGTKQATGVYAP